MVLLVLMKTHFVVLLPLTFFALEACGGGTSTNDAGSDAGPSGPLGFTPSNNVGSALAGVDTTKLGDADITLSGDQPGPACASNGCVATTVTQSDGSTLNVYIAKSWKIEPAASMDLVDNVPVVFVALTTIQVLGRIDGSASGFTSTAGGFKGATTAGGGPGGGGLGSATDNTPGVGGGGASYCGVGGLGGNGAATVGEAGKTYGAATLVPLVGGSAGGSGALFGGGGGGAVQLVAGTSITIGGVVSVGGGGGSKGGGYATGQAASGGGSGGSILLESPNVTISGTLEANGGGGGGGATGTNGADATPNATAAAGGDPSTTGSGGNGSAGATTSGGAGGAGDPPNPGNDVSGGGGGGAGMIRINSVTASTSLSGTLSPPIGTCATQGPLTP
jgi:hypothetical protein